MSYVVYHCGYCSVRLKVDPKHQGHDVRCPLCRSVSRVSETNAEESKISSLIAAAGSDEGHDDRQIDFPNLGLSVLLDELGRFAVVEVVPSGRGVPARESLEDELCQKGVTFGLFSDAITALFESIHARTVRLGDRVCVARYSPPVEGRGARVVLAEPQKLGTRVSDEADSARVDFREVSAMWTVCAGDVVGEVQAPVKPRSGKNIFGELIPPQEAPEPDHRLGDGVALASDGVSIVATRAGRPELSEGMLSVLEIFEIDGDVDFSTGNIRFDGHVAVRGSVLDEFEIECRSLEVEGVVGASVLCVKSDALIGGGVNGNGKCRITVGGNLETKYLNQVSAHVGGDVSVERGITNSEIVCWGMLSTTRLVGGKSSARLGYIVQNLGSELGVVTVVGPGLIRLPSYSGPNEPIVELSGEARRGIGNAELDEHSLSSPAALRDLRHNTLKRLLAPAANDDLEVSLAHRVAVVSVTSQLHADVVVCNANRCREFMERTNGKLSIGQPAPDEEFEILPFKDLDKKRSG